MRILPHHNDTGGFFVAVFKKVTKHSDTSGVKRPRQEGKGAADSFVEAASEQADAALQQVSHSNACCTLTSANSLNLLHVLEF